MSKVKLVNCEVPLGIWMMFLEDKGAGDYLKINLGTYKMTQEKPLNRVGYITIDQINLSSLKREK